MTHYGEEELVLYYYGEGRNRAAIERHLDACAECASTYRDIAGTLTIITAPETPERGDRYGLEVWQRIRHRLPAQDVPLWKAWLPGERLAVLAAAACLVLAAFVAGRMWPSDARTAGPAAAPTARTESAATAPNVRERILVSQVADHLDRSERVLTDIMNSSSRTDISAEQAWATDLLDASRLYRQDAIDLGERSVADVLDDLERSLVEIVHSPSTASAADLEQIRRRIDAAALLFKVRVLGNELRQRESAPEASPRAQTQTRKIS